MNPYKMVIGDMEVREVKDITLLLPKIEHLHVQAGYRSGSRRIRVDLRIVGVGSTAAVETVGEVSNEEGTITSSGCSSGAGMLRCRT